MKPTWIPVATTIAVALPLLSASAETDRRITLSLDGVTLAQAANALRSASGVDVRAARPREAAVPEQEKKATFRWKDVTLTDALTEVARAFQVEFSTNLFGYRLTTVPEPFRTPAVLPAEGRTTQAGEVQLIAGAPRWGRDLPGTTPYDSGDPNREQLNLEVLARWPTGDSRSLAGIANVAARDDRGTLITCQSLSPFPLGMPRLGGTPPDSRNERLTFPFADRRARKLEWLEGDLLVYRGYMRSTLDLPFRIGHPGVTKQVGDVRMEIECYPPRPPDKPGQDPVGPSLEIRTSEPVGTSRDGRYPEIAAELVDAAGRSITSYGSYRYSSGDGNNRIQRYDLDYPRMPDSPVSVLIAVVIKRDPGRLASFRFTDIPLPPAPEKKPTAQ